MADAHYQAIELEGRVISSSVALFVWALLRWGVPLAWPVSILTLSVSIDLLRAAWRKHLLDMSIVGHHLATIVVSVVQLCLFYGHSLIDQGTAGLLGMELTNPFLHGAWIFAKHPRFQKETYAKMAVQNFMIGALVLWPLYRIWPSLKFAFLLWTNSSSQGLLQALASVCVTSLAYLQIAWFFKLVKLVKKDLTANQV